MNWFAAVELLRVEGNKRVSAEFVPVEGIEDRFDDDMAAQWQALTAPRPPLRLGERMIQLDQPQVMGIVNVTPDSFSGDGQSSDLAAAAAAGAEMAVQGAAIIDVGGESTRPGAKPVWEGDEIERIAPVVRQLAAGGTAVSADTRKADVMTAALEAGARMINDVSALTYDDRSAEVIAAAGVPVVLMHHQGAPESMQDDPRYDDVLVELYAWLEDRISAAVDAGIDREPDPDRSRFWLRQDCRPQPRADERAWAVPFARLPAGARREPQAHDRRAFRRSAGGPAPRWKHRLRAQGRRAGRAVGPSP